MKCTGILVSGSVLGTRPMIPTEPGYRLILTSCIDLPTIRLGRRRETNQSFLLLVLPSSWLGWKTVGVGRGSSQVEGCPNEAQK